MGADRITNGPLSSAGTNPFDQQALIQDSTNNTLSISGVSKKVQLLRTAVLVLTAQAARVAITVAQTLLSQAFNAGALNVTGRRVRVKGSAIYSTTALNVATISIALKLGAVVLCTITTDATDAGGNANLPIQFEFELTVVTLGAAATIESHGRVEANIGSVAASPSTVYLDTNAAVSAAVNLLTAETLSVTVAASAAVPSLQLRAAVVELVA